MLHERMCKMFKVIFILVLAYYFTQNIYVASNDEALHNEIKSIEKRVKILAKNNQHDLKKMSNRLFKLTTNFETDINFVMSAYSLEDIVATVKEQTHRLTKDDSPTTLTCHELALKELDNLVKVNTQDVTTCVIYSISKRRKIERETQELIQKYNDLIAELLFYAFPQRNNICVKNDEENTDIKDCVQQYRESVNVLQNLLEKMKQSINASISATKIIFEAIVADFETCLKILEEDTQKKSQYTFQQFKTCLPLTY